MRGLRFPLFYFIEHITSPLHTLLLSILYKIHDHIEYASLCLHPLWNSLVPMSSLKGLVDTLSPLTTPHTIAFKQPKGQFRFTRFTCSIIPFNMCRPFKTYIENIRHTLRTDSMNGHDESVKTTYKYDYLHFEEGQKICSRKKFYYDTVLQFVEMKGICECIVQFC